MPRRAAASEAPRPAPAPAAPAAPIALVDEARPGQVVLPEGAALAELELASVVPRAQALTLDDGTPSGIILLPLEELEELDDLEVIVDEPPEVIARRALAATPLFAQLPAAALERMIARMALVELAPDQVLFREGDRGATLYVISEGEVAVESAVGELARLGPGAFFGEIALVTDLPRSATIRALTACELLAIDRDVIRQATAARPEVVTTLLRFVRDRLAARITRTSELFAPFTEDDRLALAGRFELVEVVPDATLIIEGERADGLYVVIAGAVEVARRGTPAPLATLGPGDVFGEMSLLAGGGSTASVRARSRVLALRMPAKTFREVIMTHPQVLAYLGDLAERRAPRAQDGELVDLHLELL